jgi:hypothetical protein
MAGVKWLKGAHLHFSVFGVRFPLKLSCMTGY